MKCPFFCGFAGLAIAAGRGRPGSLFGSLVLGREWGNGVSTERDLKGLSEGSIPPFHTKHQGVRSSSLLLASVTFDYLHCS